MHRSKRRARVAMIYSITLSAMAVTPGDVLADGIVVGVVNFIQTAYGRQPKVKFGEPEHMKFN